MTARMAAKVGGFQEPWLDAVGNWSHKTTGREFYEDFRVPKETSDVILQTKIVSDAIKRGLSKRGDPMFEEENEDSSLVHAEQEREVERNSLLEASP